MKKSTKKKIVKVAKKHPVLAVVAILLVVAIVVCCVLHYKRVIHIPFLDGIIPQEQHQEDIITDELSIHFIELDTYSTGDCTLIKTGNTEILIDAGAIKSCAPTISEYINEYCTDGVLEYVIATHAHEDHISAFVGTKKNGARNGILYTYKVETLIQFAGVTNKTSGGTLYAEYQEAVEYAKQTNQTKVYSALDCVKGLNGAQATYTLNEGITMSILYQRFYEDYTDNENDYSVCTLLSQGNNHYLFTGDLDLDGETSLAENNDLPKCKLYKAGHHGSKTSSNEVLLQEIQPEIVCVCCCAGSDEYTKNNANQFPTQEFIDRIAPYTDKIYVTTLAVDKEANTFTSMNGDIVVSSNGGEVHVTCSNNDVILKETTWFKENRTWNGKGS